jgi:galactofuranosylgalactofuranosylrhamnosyl-N-acetylglucosaminyl-diphospho-decaprenol beta-1,5/1,6-galactofuranosyltransferase
MPSSTPAKSGSATTRHPAERLRRAPGHSTTNRLEAQRGLFRGPDPVCPDGLYATVERGSAVRERHRLVVHPHALVSMDTYFGRFPAAYWQRWTVVDQVDVELAVTGSGQLSLVASDAAGETRVVATQTVDGVTGAVVRLNARLDRFLDGGFLWLDFVTQDSDLVIEKLRWTVAPPARLRTTAVVICTFNRADDCVRTLESLAGDRDALDVLDAVYVVDQGTDTVDSRQGFPDVEKALEGRLRYLRQPNLGGAGGFSRGMYEVTEVDHAEHANLLFMDDDVLCEPEVAVRLTAFANRTVAPTIVGGQMLRLLHPTRLIAGAEYADFNQLVPGLVVANALDDVDLLEAAVDADGVPTGRPNRGDRRVDAEYNAWWSCLIPSELVAELGYPLPLFFQWDDVEYGYRARANGFPTVTLPGAGLWHADFDWKDADKWSEYFAVRNSMIVSALHSPFDPRRIARTLSSRVLRYLLTMQYGLVATILKAAEDFLDGPRILRDGGVAAAASIRRLRAEFPDTVMHSPSDLPGLRTSGTPMVQAAPPPARTRLVLLKRLIEVALGKSRHQLGAVPAVDSTWWHMAQFASAVVTDASQEGVRVRERDRATTVAQARQLARVVRRLLAEGPQVKEAYRAAVPELTSRENWQRLYGLSQDS